MTPQNAQFWNLFSAVLRAKIGEADVAAWVSPGLDLVSFDASIVPNRVVFRPISPWHYDWVSDNLLPDITAACTVAAGQPAVVELLGGSREQVEAPPNLGHRPASTVDRTLTFETFVVGKCNEFANAAAMAVTDAPGRVYNPLFIYGSTGLGKTHLCHAIGNRVTQLNPETRVAYFPAQQFFEQMVRAIKNRANLEFQEQFRVDVDLLIIDDIQFIVGRERTEEELFHIFEGMQQAGKQIVLTSDEPPRNLGKLAPRLRTRFEGGLLADVQPPDAETMMAILAQKAERMRLDIPSDVQFTIAQRVRSSVRELEGVLKRLAALHVFYRAPITQAFLAERMSDLVPPPAPPPTPQLVLERVADYYHVRVVEILGTRRHANIVGPRQMAMYLTRRITEASFPDIGRLFNRDNSTVQYACDKVEKAAEKDPNVRAEIEAIERRCRARDT